MEAKTSMQNMPSRQEKGANTQVSESETRKRDAANAKTLEAYDAQHESRPWADLDDGIYKIHNDPKHIKLNKYDLSKDEIVVKKKAMAYDYRRKSIQTRTQPAFNYEPVRIDFEWADFVVATPIRPSSDAEETKEANAIVQKAQLLRKEGMRLPCGSYVIVSSFIRPLEDGNENVRVHIYDIERVEQFQYDFSEEKVNEYVSGWNGDVNRAKKFVKQFSYCRKEESIVIKLPAKTERSRDTEEVKASCK